MYNRSQLLQCTNQTPEGLKLGTIFSYGEEAIVQIKPQRGWNVRPERPPYSVCWYKSNPRGVETLLLSQLLRLALMVQIKPQRGWNYTPKDANLIVKIVQIKPQRGWNLLVPIGCKNTWSTNQTPEGLKQFSLSGGIRSNVQIKPQRGWNKTHVLVFNGDIMVQIKPQRGWNDYKELFCLFLWLVQIKPQRGWNSIMLTEVSILESTNQTPEGLKPKESIETYVGLAGTNQTPEGLKHRDLC